MDKKKKFNLNLEIFRDIFQIYPRVHGQNFDELPTDEDIVSFFKLITDVVVDQMHQPWRTFLTIINRSLSGKTTGLDKLLSPEEPTRKSKRVKRTAKKSTNVPTTGVVIRETPVMSLFKKKEKATDSPPSAAKIKPSVINEGTSAKLGVPDVTKEESTKSEAES
ncbi:hypothetical protein Tco_0067421 [Tanacetum coccineum]